MQINNKILDDIAKLASSTAGSVLDAKRELENLIAAQMEKFLQKMDLVTREEFDTAQAMIAKLRIQQEELQKRLDALEAKKAD
jgi:BMFP domain-containing protein YqiC